MKPRTDFASDEEFYFYCWLLEAEHENLIAGIVYQPEPFELSPRFSVKYNKQLKTKIKEIDKFLFHPHFFTPDFKFEIIHVVLDKFFINTAYMGKFKIIVDVKGGFNKYGDPKQFSINQKWVYADYDEYIEKIIPEKLFKKTWVPEMARLSPVKKQPVKKYIGCNNIYEFIGRK